MGRCGNFLFQAATALGYAVKHGVPFTVPSTTRNTMWSPVYFSHLVNPFYDDSLPKIYIVEKEHCFQELPFTYHEAKGNIVLKGYWQSYKYFDFCRDRVIDAFKLPYTYLPGRVAVHVRRGDYLQHHPHINPLATREYYEKAVRELWLQGYKKFVVFSDDLPWCKKEFQDPVYKGVDFIYSDGESVLGDLAIMSGCEHTIMSNSTFAWWGAWLNQNPNKIVICPHEDNYYGPGNQHLDMSTFYPPIWKRIKYEKWPGNR